MSRLLVVLMLSLVVAACSSVVRVYQGEDRSKDGLPGIPFFVRTPQMKRVLVYTDTWLRATLTVEKKVVAEKVKDEEPVGTTAQQFEKHVPKPPSDNLNAIKAALVTADSSSQKVATELIKQFNDLEEVDRTKPNNREQIRNAVVTEWVVDPKRTLYLNAPLPWFGSNSFSTKLGADGTLQEAASAPDTKVADGISALLPIKEYLTGEFVKPVPEVKKDDPTTLEVLKAITEIQARHAKGLALESEMKFVYSLSLTIEEFGYEHTLESQPIGPDGKVPEIKFENFGETIPADVNYTRRLLGPPETKPEVSGNSIEITGQITLPDDKGAPAPEKPKP